MSKNTETQDAIEEMGIELEELKKDGEKAVFIVEKLPAIKRAYSTRLSETEEEATKALGKPGKDAPVDDMIAFNEERKVREHQYQVRLNTIDRLDRQIKMGKVMGWEKSVVDCYNDMHNMITGQMLAK